MNENAGLRAPGVDGAVVLLQNIVQILYWTVLAILLKGVLVQISKKVGAQTRAP